MTYDRLAFISPAVERHLHSFYRKCKVLGGREEHLFGFLIGRLLARRVARWPTRHTEKPGRAQVMFLRGAKIALTLGISAGLLEWLCARAVCFCPFLAVERAESGKDTLVVFVEVWSNG